MSFFSASLLLFMIMDGVGNAPMFAAMLANLDPPRRRRVILRESLIALAALVIFLFFGPALLSALNIDTGALRLAGGIVLFLIALRMIFPWAGGVFGDEKLDGEPLVVPLAIPLLAGPGAMAMVILLGSQEPERRLEWLAALVVAWLPTLGLLLIGTALMRRLGRRGLIAVERLMGMLLTVLAVQMFIQGLKWHLPS
jgi:multiple antibiotic resistance protein